MVKRRGCGHITDLLNHYILRGRLLVQGFLGAGLLLAFSEGIQSVSFPNARRHSREQETNSELPPSALRSRGCKLILLSGSLTVTASIRSHFVFS